VLYICGNSAGTCGNLRGSAQLWSLILRTEVSLRAAGLFLLWSVVVSSQEPSAELRGTVVNAGGDLLHTARVELRGGEIRRLAETGTTGAFDFTRVPPGVYSLEISENLHFPATIRSVRLEAGRVRVLPPLELLFEGVSNCRRIPAFLRVLDRLDAAKGSLGGAIVDDRGSPLSDARVRVYVDNAGIIGSAVSDPDGRFEVRDLPARDRYKVEVARDGHYTEDFSEFLVEAGYETVYNLDLAACENGRCIQALHPVRPIPSCL